MKVFDLLSETSGPVLARFAHQPVALIFDYDGTLAPIVDEPAKAFMRDSTKRLLRQVAAVFPCAVLTGRDQGQVSWFLTGTGVRCVVGNHGLEWDRPGREPDAIASKPARWAALLKGAISELPGVHLELKRYSLAIHYRHSSRRVQAKERLLAETAKLEDARVLDCKETVNLLPRDVGNKGTAVDRIREVLECDGALFAGDDVTDEDVFALRSPNLLAVRIEESATSAARYFLRDQGQIDELLKRLLLARSGAALRSR